MFSRFFIDRPIFAAVLSILIALAGALSIFHLPLAQYPPVTPPTVQVNCNYPGASAQVVAQTVAAPIEQQVNGVEGMLYMASQCTNDGSYNLAVTFRQGIDLNLAQVLVQNRVNLALPMLPDVLKKTAIVTRKMSPDILMSVNINSPDGRYDQLYLSNFALMRLRDELNRLEGISDIFISGQRDYSMRIWLDPDKLASRNLTTVDVVAAIREQNMQVACGQVGQHAEDPGQNLQITLSTLGRLKEPEQFEDIVLRTTRDGRILRLRDVGRVTVGPKSQDVNCRLDGKPSVGLVIFQLPDANALDLADRIHAKMKELSRDFPEGLIYEIQYDTTPYTRECISEVFKSLRDAIMLVALVVMLFLQNWRSAVIPLVAVPVAVIGTFAVMYLLGFSLNNLTLFGLVLAIGIVVDDAIVVVESVEHHIENGLAPRDATLKAMSQVSGPVVAVGLVLSAVFIPCAFISGITGQFFRQFALTIATSTVISAFNSLTLSPALAAVLLQERDKDTHEALPRGAFPFFGAWFGYAWLSAPLTDMGNAVLKWTGWELPETVTWCFEWIAILFAMAAPAVLLGLFAARINGWMRWFFHGFNAVVQGAIHSYTRTVGRILRWSVLALVLYGGLLVLTGISFKSTPKGFIPTQDMGYLLLSAQLPDAASAERTRAAMDRVQNIVKGTPGVKHMLAIAGQSLVLSVYGSNFGSMFVILDDFAQRRGPGLSADEIAATLRKRLTAEVPEAMLTVLPAPPVRGVGRTGGFKLMVEDRGDLGLTSLQAQTDNLAARGRTLKDSRQRPNLVIAPNVFRANAPQLYVDMNREQCIASGVSLSDAFNTLQTYLGSLYVNDFNRFGRTWQVIVQADSSFRTDIHAAHQLKVRNSQGTMVPIGSLAEVREVNGPLILTRYNMYPAAAIQGTPSPGVSSRQAIDMMQGLADSELLPSTRYEWTEMAYLELQAGNTATVLFGLAVVMVFLVLAAQYESWSLPLAVILVVPLCLLSAIVGLLIGGIDINIFTQIGFVVLAGLASKNAILIVEFAKRQREAGRSRHEAALDACQLRLRPIVMTSSAFILGVSPLLAARGAGAEMRRMLGTAVFSGMLGVTLFALFLTPVFFNVIDWLGGKHLFQTRIMRRIGRFGLAVLTLGMVPALNLLTKGRRRNPDDSAANPDKTPRE